MRKLLVRVKEFLCREQIDRFMLLAFYTSESIENQWVSLMKEKSGQVNSKFLVFSEILARNCALVFLEHHQPTQYG